MTQPSGTLATFETHSVSNAVMTRRMVLALAALCFASTAIAYGLDQPSEARPLQQPQPSTNQQATGGIAPHESTKFTATMMANGVTKSGAEWGGTIWETPTHTIVNAETVYLRSHEDAEKEYGDWMKMAINVVEQGKIQDEAEQRAVVTVSGTRGCDVANEILFTSGKLLRVITSCSLADALEFERQASQPTKPSKP
jgi:hypothetical protein